MSVKFSETIPGVTPERLHEIEQIIGVVLPAQYKAFLLHYNGSRPKPAHFTVRWTDQQPVKGWNRDLVDYFLSVVEGSSSDFLKYQEAFSGRIPSDTVVIAHDPGGNQILLGTGEQNYGQVFLWMHSYETDEEEETDYSNVGFVANSFNEFIDSFYEGE